MSKEDQATMSKKELEEIIMSTIKTCVQAQQAPRIQALRETSILHCLNVAGKGKGLLRATADLGLSVIDAAIAIPASLVKSEIIVPSLDVDSIARWLWEEEPQQDEAVMVID